MGGRYLLVAALAGCADLAGIGSPALQEIDAPDVPCAFGGLDLCLFARPLNDFVLSSDLTVDTDRDCNVELYQPPQPGICVVYARSIRISAKLRGVGGRPLVLAATTTIDITGSVDVSSARLGEKGAAANDSACVDGMYPTGYGGTWGGSFAGKGGNGGNGVSPNATTVGIASPAIAMPTYMRGGCRGYPDTDSGGAVWLAAASSITIASTGSVLANGEGARAAGSRGYGGGSGGYIRLSAPTLTVAGVLAANGGGGSEGESEDFLGNGGAAGFGGDGLPSAMRASGGSGATASGGDGGAGGARDALDGSPGGPGAIMGSDTAAYGGGGGGGAGFVQLLGASIESSAATISPAPTL